MLISQLLNEYCLHPNYNRASNLGRLESAHLRNFSSDHFHKELRSSGGGDGGAAHDNKREIRHASERASEGAEQGGWKDGGMDG